MELKHIIIFDSSGLDVPKFFTKFYDSEFPTSLSIWGRISFKEHFHQNCYPDIVAVYFSSTLDLTLMGFPVEGNRC